MAAITIAEQMRSIGSPVRRSAGLGDRSRPGPGVPSCVGPAQLRVDLALSLANAGIRRSHDAVGPDAKAARQRIHGSSSTKRTPAVPIKLHDGRLRYVAT